jgi:hypothetical protein
MTETYVPIIFEMRCSLPDLSGKTRQERIDVMRSHSYGLRDELLRRIEEYDIVLEDYAWINSTAKIRISTSLLLELTDAEMVFSAGRYSFDRDPKIPEFLEDIIEKISVSGSIRPD